MSLSGDPSGLFLDPLIGGLFSRNAPSISPDDASALGFTAAEVQALIANAQPALRGLKLAGYQPLALDIIDALAVPKVARVEFDEAYTIATASPDLDWLDAITEQVFYAIVIYAKPFVSPGGSSYAMQIPLDGTGWSIGPGRPEDGADSVSLRLNLTEVPTLVDLELKLGPVTAFQTDIATYFAGEWASIPQPDLNAALPSPAKGLLWLLEPRHWFMGEHFNNTHGSSILTFGKDAQIESGATREELRTYFEAQMSGDWRTRETIDAATGKPMRAFFRAGSFIRAIQRWSDSGTAPYESIPDDLKPITRQLPWFDVICYLVEAKILMPPGLEQGALYDADLDVLDLEPLIARKPTEYGRVIELCLRDIPGTTTLDPYGVVARISAVELMQVDADILYGSSPAQSPPIQEFETMFTWEYVPSEVEGELPKLLIVAGPGVTVAKTHGAPVDIQILRKTDFGIPRWGERIDVQALYRPAFIAANTSGSGATHASAGFMVVEKENGIEYNYYPYLTLNSEDLTPVSIPDEPHSKVEITVSNTSAGTIAFRSDIDFVQVNYYGGMPATPILRIWRTGPEVTIKTSVSTGVAIGLQVFDQPDIHKMFDLYPHLLPVTDWVTGDFQNVISDARPSGSVAFRGDVTQTLPFITNAELAAAGFTHIDTNGWLDPGLNIELSHSFGWYDFLLLGADLVIGLHPYSIALDVAEFFYAYNTGLDRYGRPITTFDLYLMAAGIALPVSGYMLTQIKKGGVILKARWVPPAGAAADEAADLMSAAARQADGLEQAGENTVRQAVQTMLSRYADDALGVLTEAEAAALGSLRALANLMDGGKSAFKSFELNYHYRRWLCSQVISAGQTLNPKGLV